MALLFLVALSCDVYGFGLAADASGPYWRRDMISEI